VGWQMETLLQLQIDGDKEDASRDENVVDLSIQDSNIIVR